MVSSSVEASLPAASCGGPVGVGSVVDFCPISAIGMASSVGTGLPDPMRWLAAVAVVVAVPSGLRSTRMTVCFADLGW